jgi:hypothetical protein
MCDAFGVLLSSVEDEDSLAGGVSDSSVVDRGGDGMFREGLQTKLSIRNIV